MNLNYIKKLKSKRNSVYIVKANNLINDEIAIFMEEDISDGDKIKSQYMIMKKYNKENIHRLKQEYENIKMMEDHSIPVPKIIMKTHDSLFLEYLQGKLIDELVEKQSLGNWIDRFALWMSRLHKITFKGNSLLKSDANLRNFIYVNDMVYGLDFEEMGYGDPRNDLADICFYILTNTPSFTRKKHLIMRQFLTSYENYSESKLKEMGKFLLHSRERAKIRRKKSRLTGNSQAILKEE